MHYNVRYLILHAEGWYLICIAAGDKMSKPTSIIKKISVQMTLIVAILLAALILSNVYSLAVVQNNAVANSKQALSYHVNNIQNNLNNASMDLLELFDTHIDSFLHYREMTSEQQYFALIELRKSMSAKVSRGGATDMFFMVIPDEDLLAGFISNQIYAKEILLLSDYIKSYEFEATRGKTRDEWLTFDIEGQAYLLKVLQYADVVFGTVVKSNTLISPMLEVASDQSIYYLSNSAGDILSATSSQGTAFAEGDSTHQGYLHISQSVPEFGSITNIVEKRNVLFGLETIQWVIIGLSVVAIIVLPIIFRSFSKNLFQPIVQLNQGAKEVERGNWDYEMPEKTVSLEFNRLFKSFNSMTREIKTLKIVSYEEKLERHKAELKFLQMQLKPHFFLNAISTVSSLTFYNKNAEIRQLIDYLSNHLRYMFKGGLTQVQIIEEMQHVDNYIQMQVLRYPDRIFYMTDISEGVSTHKVPQYIIHTFVENTFKHALSHKEMLSVFIKAEQVVQDGTDFVRILIEDDGDGFPPEVVKKFSDENSTLQERGENIGMINIKQTLKLLYKRDDLLTICNIKPHGAQVQILIPIDSETR